MFASLPLQCPTPSARDFVGVQGERYVNDWQATPCRPTERGPGMDGKSYIGPAREAETITFQTEQHSAAHHRLESPRAPTQVRCKQPVEGQTDRAGIRKKWREREGVEPTVPVEAPGPTILKTAGPTGAHPLPRGVSVVQKRGQEDRFKVPLPVFCV